MPQTRHVHIHVPDVRRPDFKGVFAVIGGFIRRNVVLCVAVVAAAITCLIIPPDAEYASYFDLRTLSCLFCVLAVVCALRNIRFFRTLAHATVAKFGSTRSCFLALCCITFIGSMLIANDMALLTFLPLGYTVLHDTGKERYMAFLFVMQNLSANLGGMLTPFGNPQNLYLYSYFSIPTGEFMLTMLPSFAAAIALIAICCMCVKNEKLSVQDIDLSLPKGRTVLYLALFALSILIVFRGIPYWIGLVVIPATLIFADKKALKDVDYPLLLTFCAFFVFAGNMARIPAISGFLSGLMQKSTLLFSQLSCQVISNVPSAILLSRFTTDWQGLLLGVNIGSAGTLIASLASLITFREYTKHNPGKALRYLGIYTLLNLLFLGALNAVVALIGQAA